MLVFFFVIFVFPFHHLFAVLGAGAPGVPRTSAAFWNAFPTTPNLRTAVGSAAGSPAGSAAGCAASCLGVQVIQKGS